MELQRVYGSRIMLARQSLGLTKIELAEKIGVSSTTIKNFEVGLQDSKAYILKLSDALKQPPEFFWGSPSNIELSGVVAFRSLRSMRQIVKKSVEAKATIALLNVEPMFRDIRRTDSEWPDLSGLRPEQAAFLTRQWLGMGSECFKRDLLLEFELVGLRPYWYFDDSDKTVGMSFWQGGNCYIFLKNHGQSAQRDNWTIAHEIGHLVMHRGIDGVQQRQELDDEANEFARFLLAPKGPFIERVVGSLNLESLQQLKDEYRMSIGAIIRTAYEYDVLNEQQYYFANRRIQMNGWKRIEPGDRGSQRSARTAQRLEEWLTQYSGLDSLAKSGFHISVEMALELQPQLSSMGILRSLEV